MSQVVSFGPFCLYAQERRLERGGESVKIGSRALDILVALTDRAGEIVSREDLTARVWPDTAVEESGLRVHVAGLRKALGDGRNGARYVTNVPGRGYSFVAQVARSSPATPSTTLPKTAPAASSLPPMLERIVGREDFIGDVSTRLLAERFVTIVGPGGMGKTTVAIAVAHALLSTFEGDVCFVDLGAIADPRQASISIASALGLVVHTDDVGSTLATFLSDRRALLVLDSCEHVMSTVAPLAERITTDAAGIHVLATSREPLHVEREHVHRMAPLETPTEGAVATAAEALRYPAVQLFVERASAGGARVSLTDVDALVVAEICRRLDGIALAIEMAAGRVEAYGVRGTASLLENRFKLLWHGRRTAIPRHQTLSAMLEWSYSLLSDVERALLRRLSVFVGFFSLDAVAGMSADLDPEQAVDALGGLVDKSLVAVEGGGASGVRYRLLDTTRAYVHGKVEAATEQDALARSHALCLCSMLEEQNRIAQKAHVQSRDVHVGNVRVALEWSFSKVGDISIGTRLAAAAAPMFMESSLLRECRQWTEVALAALDDAERGTRREMDLQAALGVSAMFTRGNSIEVREALDRGLALADHVGDPHEQLRLLGALNILLTRTAEWREALAVGRRAEQIASRLVDDPAARASAEWMVGTSVHLLGDPVEAEQRCRNAVIPAPASGSSGMLYFGFDHRIRGLVVLGRSLWLLGRPDEAAQVARQTVRDAVAIGQPTTVAIALCWTSSIFVWRGDLDEASDLVDKLVRFSAKHSLGPYHSVGLGLLAELAVKRGEAAGVAALRRAMDALHAGRHDLLRTVFAVALAEGLARAGQLGEALTTIDNAIEMTSINGGASFDLPEILRTKGQLLAAQRGGDDREAERYLLDALARAKQQHALGWELRAALAIARLWSAGRRTKAAHDLLADAYGRFSEGFDTADLIAAQKLLAQL